MKLYYDKEKQKQDMLNISLMIEKLPPWFGDQIATYVLSF